MSMRDVGIFFPGIHFGQTELKLKRNRLATNLLDVEHV